MATYKKRVTKRGVNKGRVSFFRDGKAILAEDLPTEVLALLAGSENVEIQYEDKEATPEIEAPEGRVSYLSGEPATRTRWLNGRVYNLTQEEYQSLTLGKLAQAIREKDSTDG